MEYGVEESIVLDSIVYWARTNRSENRNFYDGRWWTYNSINGMAEMFPWWSKKQIRRILDKCADQGALLKGNYNKDGRDRTIWYSPSDKLLALYGEDWSAKCICPNGQMHLPERADTCAQTGKPLPCNNYHVNAPYNPPDNHQNNQTQKRKRKQKSAPVHKPDRFEKFWELYPGGGSRQRAVDAWDKLAPDDKLIAEMGAALLKQMESPLWKKGIGIPYASTWLNGRRWTDKLPPAQTESVPDHGRDAPRAPRVPVYIRTETDPLTGEERDIYE